MNRKIDMGSFPPLAEDCPAFLPAEHFALAISPELSRNFFLRVRRFTRFFLAR